MHSSSIYFSVYQFLIHSPRPCRCRCLSTLTLTSPNRECHILVRLLFNGIVADKKQKVLVTLTISRKCDEVKVPLKIYFVASKSTCIFVLLYKLTFLANVNSLSPVRLSVCLSVCLSSVTIVHHTQAMEIFGNVSTPSVTLAICDLSIKILRRSSQGNPSVRGGLNRRGVANIAILDLSIAISRKRCQVGGKLLLMTNRKSHMSFRLVSKSVT